MQDLIKILCHASEIYIKSTTQLISQKRHRQKKNIVAHKTKLHNTSALEDSSTQTAACATSSDWTVNYRLLRARKQRLRILNVMWADKTHLLNNLTVKFPLVLMEGLWFIVPCIRNVSSARAQKKCHEAAELTWCKFSTRWRIMLQTLLFCLSNLKP